MKRVPMMLIILTAGMIVMTAAQATLASEPVSSLASRFATADAEFVVAQRTLGDYGCRTIRSQARWGEVQSQLAQLGWRRPSGGSALGEIDFDKQMIVMVHKCGDEGDRFAVRRYQDGDSPSLELVMGYIIYKSRAKVVNGCNFILAVVPLAKRLSVSVSTYHPHNGGPYPTPEKARLEWRGVVGSEAGDIVDGLQGTIEAKSPKGAVGQDIQVKFTLQLAGEALVKDGQCASPREAVCVWDGKYSNGYRNHAFEVRSPDGKVRLLRPAVIDQWDKNAPHPVEIKAGKPYVLPEWYEGAYLKSLEKLGLDTGQAGRYVITGIYMEKGGTAQMIGQGTKMWGGDIATNTITVEVVR